MNRRRRRAHLAIWLLLAPAIIGLALLAPHLRPPLPAAPPASQPAASGLEVL